MNEGVLSSRVIAEHPPVELVDQRDDHTRVWKVVRDVQVTDPVTGEKRLEQTESLIKEKGCGLCYQDASGNWQPSVIEWETTPSGFQITRAGYVATKGPLSDDRFEYNVRGMSLRFGPSELILYDGKWQQTMAEIVTDLPGQIDEADPSKLRFDNAFGKGIHLEFEAERDGVHQNIIFNDKVELPPEMDPAASYLYAATELSLDEAVSANAVKVSMAGERLPVGDPSFFTEPTHSLDIVFSEAGGEELCRLVDSHVSDSSGAFGPEASIIAEKQLARIPETGNTYLFERIPHSFLAETDKYPVKWDWHEKSGTMNNDQTWSPRYTYYVSSTLTVASEKTLTINPGTVVKLEGDSTTIQVNGTLIARGEPYNYIIFTSAYDDDCGEDLDGPGKPLSEEDPEHGDYVAAFWLGTDVATLQNLEVRYCKFAYGTCALGTNYSANQIRHDIRDCILKHCSYGFLICVPADAAAIRNNLFVNVGLAMILSSANDWAIYNNTFDGPERPGDTGVWLYSSSGVDIRYNIFTDIYDPVYGTPQTIQYNAYYPSVEQNPEDTNPLELGGLPYEGSILGEYHLDDEAESDGWECRDGNGFQTFDVYPDDVGLGSDVYTTNKPGSVPSYIPDGDTWEKIAGDTGKLDLGYHHGRVDYYIDSDPRLPSGRTMTINPGVVVAFKSQYVTAELDIYGTLTCKGSPSGDGYVCFTSKGAASMEIERPTLHDSRVGSLHMKSGSASSELTFTRFECGAWLYVYTSLTNAIRSCIFRFTGIGAYATVDNTATNCLFHCCQYGYYYTDDTATIANCTFDHNYIGIMLTSSSDDLTLQDSLLTSNGRGIRYMYSMPGSRSHNVYWNNDTNIELYPSGSQGPSSSEVFLDYDECPYDRDSSDASSDPPQENEASWYLDQDSVAVNFGSQMASDAGLAEYSTSRYAVIDSGYVDVGYHHVAVDESASDGMEGAYVDSDNDRMADVWEIEFFGDLTHTGTGDGDDDGLDDLEEYHTGTAPDDDDTDNDGWLDGQDTFGNGPTVTDFDIGPYMTNLRLSPNNGITIAWATPINGGTHRVHYYDSTEASDQTSAASSQGQYLWDGETYYVYEAKLHSLSPDTLYFYRVETEVPDSGKGLGPIYTFPSAPTENATFTFVVYGDNRWHYNDSTYNSYHEAVADRIMVQVPDGRFVCHVGDFVYTASQDAQWRQHFFRPARGMLPDLPLLPASGNHEYNGDSSLSRYRKYFDYPEESSTRAYYSFDYAQCHFVVLDTKGNIENEQPALQEFGYNRGQYNQYDWLRDDLTDVARRTTRPEWIFVVMHGPVYVTPNKRLARGEELLRATFEAYGVDVVFAGHAHLYERWQKSAWVDSTEWPITTDYIVTGGGGANHNVYAGIPSGGDLKGSNDHIYHFCYLDIPSSPTGNATLYIKDKDGNDVELDGQEPRQLVESVSLTPTPDWTRLVKKAETWKYLPPSTGGGYGFDDLSWADDGFDDSEWSSGPAELGYSTNADEDDEETDIWPGAPGSGRPITYYFRTDVTVPGGTISEAGVRVLCDDGCVVYICGDDAGDTPQEICRYNMPDGTITKTTTAWPDTITGIKEERQWRTEAVASGDLSKIETGVIAVEVHQRSATSSDISFDLELLAHYQ